MTTSAGRVVLTFDVDDKGVVTGLGRVGAQVDKSTKGISTKAIAMGTAIGVAAGKVAVDALKFLGREFVDVAKRGVELAPVVTSFNNLTRSIGESGDQMLAVSRSSTKGLITDLDLMSAANKAIQLGLPVTSSSFGDLAKMATVLGRAMKQDATKSVDDLIVALGRSSPMILDNLGLTVKVGEANEAYARSVGKSSSQLTDAEKKLAFYNAALAAGNAAVDRLGGIQLTLADRIKIASNWMANFTDALGVAVATSPVINTAFDHIGAAIGEAVGENQTTRVQLLIGIVNDLAIKAISLAQVFVMGADLVIRAWEGLKLIFAGLMTGILALSEGVIKAFLTIVSAANKIPGVRGEFDMLAMALQNDAAMAEGMRQSFQEQTAEAWEGVKGNSALGQTIGALGETLGATKAAMIAASHEQVTAAEVAERLTDGLNEEAAASDAVKKAAEAATKAVDQQTEAFRALGLVTQADVTTEIQKLHGALTAAAREGAGPTQKAVTIVITKLVELRRQALAAGQSVEAIDEELAALRRTARDMAGPFPTLTAQISLAIPRAEDLAAGIRTITADEMRAGTEAYLLGRAYETLGVTTQASLERAAEAARIAYADILASGTATERQLIEARARVEQAEIEAGLRTVSLWQTQIQPAIEGAWQNITGSLATNFTDMLTGATGFKDGFTAIWEDLKGAVRSILDTMLQTFLNEFLGGMLQGLSGWSRQAGSIIGSILGMGKSGMSSLPTVGGTFIPSLTAPGAAGGGAAAGGGLAAGLATAGLGIAAGASAYTIGKMGWEWGKAFFGPHGNPGTAPEDMPEELRTHENQQAIGFGVDGSPLDDVGGPMSLSAGGEVRAGAGRPAVLHGHEAVFPLPEGFDLASSLKALDGSRQDESTLDRMSRRFENALLELKWALPSAVRAAVRST